MQTKESDVNLVLIADRPERTTMIRDLMQQARIDGTVRRIPPGGEALACARRSGIYRRQPAPDLLLFDFSYADDYTADILRQLAFDDVKSSVPVVLLTSPETQQQLDAGEIDNGRSVMFSPTALASFLMKLRPTNRARFLKALRTLFQYGPILVRTPRWALDAEPPTTKDMALTA